MRIIALVRHGQTDLNVQRRWQGSTDPPLNATGIGHALAAARQIGTHFPGIDWSRIVTSPLQRARQTANLISVLTRVPVTGTCRQLVEQHGGAAEGLTESEIRRRWPEEAEIPGIEPRTEAADRVTSALIAIAHNHSDENLLVVGHGTVLNLAITRLAGCAVTPHIPNGGMATFDVVETGRQWSQRTLLRL
ncbi:histidine phosphatase family protein [Rhodococcus opacus]|nr:histidine phosphatase family protein [Rhodococcus opacus]